MKRPRVNDKRVIYSCPYFEIREDDLEFEDGVKWTYAHARVANGGVSIVALDQHQNVYLMDEYRYTVDSSLIGLPCGGVDAGEKPIDAAKKELEEEAGLLAGKWTFIGDFLASPGLS